MPIRKLQMSFKKEFGARNKGLSAVLAAVSGDQKLDASIKRDNSIEDVLGISPRNDNVHHNPVSTFETIDNIQNSLQQRKMTEPTQINTR